MNLTPKAKQYLLASLKILVLAFTFGYIFIKLNSTQGLSFSEFITNLTPKSATAGYALLFFLILAAANWFFEILKWQSVVSVVEKIDFKTAVKQSLAALTVSLATPNRIGEYGAKIYFFEASKRKKILLLNLYSNINQMLVTTFFGGIGLFYFVQRFNIQYSSKNILIAGFGIAILLIAAYFLKRKELKNGFSIVKTITFFRNIPNTIKFKTLLFSVLRYIIFSSLFYFLLAFFSAEIGILEATPLIFTMYLLVSIVPTIFIFDVVVRGGVAIWLFSFVGVSELTILSTVLAMWLLNFVIPSLLGSFYVLTYQPTTR